MSRLRSQRNVHRVWSIGRATNTVYYRHEYLRETTRILSFHGKTQRGVDFAAMSEVGTRQIPPRI